MSPGKKTLSKGEEKRAQIRQGAYTCFKDTGYHASTVDAICKKSGLSKGSFYWHYDSKQEVFIDILEVWSREVMDELYDQFEEAVVDENYLIAITGALGRELHRGRALAPLLTEFNALAKQEREIQEALSKFYRRARAAIAEILRPVMDHHFSEAEVQAVAATVFGAYFGLLMQEQSGATRADAAETMASFMGVIGAVFSHLPKEYAHPARRERQNKPAPTAIKPPSAGDRLSTMELSAFLGTHPQGVQALTMTLREALLGRAPSLSERLVVGWRVLTYRLKRDVFSLKPQGEVLRLTFHRGVHVNDPDGLLMGAGKLSRHVELIPGEPLPPALWPLIDGALSLEAQRD